MPCSVCCRLQPLCLSSIWDWFACAMLVCRIVPPLRLPLLCPRALSRLIVWWLGDSNAKGQMSRTIWNDGSVREVHLRNSVFTAHDDLEDDDEMRRAVLPWPSMRPTRS